MNFLKKLLQREAPPKLETLDPGVRPLGSIATPVGRAGDIRALTATPSYAEALAYFTNYPPRSVMSDHSRAVLYTLIRLLRPAVVAEVGTMYAGTAEVMARALRENGGGILHTTDPLGADRCPAIIARWPQELQDFACFHALNSMDFFHWLGRQKLAPGLVLVDGNHDYEYAMFDLQMAARLLQLGGIVVMDNAEQAGPFTASRQFLRLNPAWRELGSAMIDHDRSAPFDSTRSSIPNTSFIVLQAPDYIPIGEDLRSWERFGMPSHIAGLRLEMPTQRTAGYLHYEAVLRAFQANGSIPEIKTIGKTRIDIDRAATIDHAFAQRLQFPDGAQYSQELSIAWEADFGCPPLALSEPPKSIETGSDLAFS